MHLTATILYSNARGAVAGRISENVLVPLGYQTIDLHDMSKKYLTVAAKKIGRDVVGKVLYMYAHVLLLLCGVGSMSKA